MRGLRVVAVGFLIGGTAMAGPLAPSAQAAVLPMDPLTDACAGGSDAAGTAALMIPPSWSAGVVEEAEAITIGAAAAPVEDATAPALLSFAGAYCGTTWVLNNTPAGGLVTGVVHFFFGNPESDGGPDAPAAGDLLCPAVGRLCWINPATTTNTYPYGSQPHPTPITESNSTTAETNERCSTGAQPHVVCFAVYWLDHDGSTRAKFTLQYDCKSLTTGATTQSTVQPVSDTALSSGYGGPWQSWECPSGSTIKSAHIWQGPSTATAGSTLTVGDLDGTTWVRVMNWTNSGSAPQHKLRTRQTCADENGNETTSTTYSPLFRESDPTLPTMEFAPCPAGSRLSSTDVWETDSGGTPQRQLVKITPPPLTTTTPGCEPGGVQAPCTLKLWGHLPGSSEWNSCSASGVDCSAYDPAHPDTDLFRCTWGTYTVTLGDCSNVNPDADSDTSTPTDDTTVENPADPGDDNNCGFGMFVTWNPVNWVLRPVKCALVWAFVPADGMATLVQAQTDLSGRAPWNYLLAGPTTVAALVTGFFGDSGACASDGVTDSFGLPMSILQPWCALDSGDGQGAFTVGTMRSVALCGLGVAFLWACYHRAKRLIGDNGPNDPGHADAENGADRSYSADDMLTAWESGLDEGRGGG